MEATTDDKIVSTDDAIIEPTANTSEQLHSSLLWFERGEAAEEEKKEEMWTAAENRRQSEPIGRKKSDVLAKLYTELNETRKQRDEFEAECSKLSSALDLALELRNAGVSIDQIRGAFHNAKEEEVIIRRKKRPVQHGSDYAVAVLAASKTVVADEVPRTPAEALLARRSIPKRRSSPPVTPPPPPPLEKRTTIFTRVTNFMFFGFCGDYDSAFCGDTILSTGTEPTSDFPVVTPPADDDDEGLHDEDHDDDDLLVSYTPVLLQTSLSPGSASSHWSTRAAHISDDTAAATPATPVATESSPLVDSEVYGPTPLN